VTPLDARPLDLTGPLPRGRHAVEASAGTGKTYALAALATRYLVEAGVPAGDLVVVTFTRAAAAELRDRVRARLVGALDALEAASGPTGDPTERDEIEALLCAEDVPRRAQRARTALAEFDAATITTIHGFATQVLGTLGTTAPSDPDAALVDDRGALTRQVCTDVLVTRALAGGSVPLPPLTKLATVVEAVGSNPGARVVPDDDPATVGEQAALQRRLVDAVVVEADRRRRRSGRLGFDDVLGRLRDVLLDPRRGPAARTAVRQRCAVALIGEFQDTDPVQWQIFSALFDPPGPDAALVLVGDPKQAIYGFRGADVQTYLDATATPGTVQATLATNWRSDGAVLESLEALLDGATFGDPRIGFRSVAPAEHHADRRLCDAEGRPLPALSLRLALHPDLPRNRNGIETPAAARAVLADLAQQIRRLLEEATIPDPLAESGRRTLRPSDVAVLVTANSQAPEVRDALAAVGVPAVVSRGDPVLVAPAAHQLRVLLEAIARPADPTRARAACLSWFLGWSADRLVGAGDDELAAVHEDLARWARILVERGVTEP
jgi:exodeoxyribonuclease V beta subunit